VTSSKPTVKTDDIDINIVLTVTEKADYDYIVEDPNFQAQAVFLGFFDGDLNREIYLVQGLVLEILREGKAGAENE
jgi:hypothetical protein